LLYPPPKKAGNTHFIRDKEKESIKKMKKEEEDKRVDGSRTIKNGSNPGIYKA
jgi:hypothetical protein